MNALKVTHGLILDFTLSGAGGSDVFLLSASDGTVKSLASVPVARVSGGGNVTEATSSVLTITGGSASVLTSGLTIQVKLAATGQSGYLSSTDWNTFNGKLSSALTSANVFVGNGSNVATGVAITGDIGITNTGVTSISSGVIVNADVNNSAAIALSKLAALSTNLVTATNGSGIITTVAGFTTTIAGYLTGITSAVQTQIDGKLSVTLTSPNSGDVITYNGAAWVNSVTGSGTLPIGGTANQFLTKINSTNYNTQWHTLVAADVSDVTSTAAELNKLTGVTTTAAQFNYLNTSTSDIQTQLDLKLNAALTQNYLFVGNASNVAIPFATGTNGYILTSVGGVPTWVAPGAGGTVTSIDVSGGTTGLTTSGGPVSTSGTITLAGILIGANGGTGVANSGKTITLGGNLTTSGSFASIFTMTGTTAVTFPVSGTLSTFSNTATNNELIKSNGTNGIASGLFASSGNLTMGTGLSGASRILSIAGTASDISYTILTKGFGDFNVSANLSTFLLQDQFSTTTTDAATNTITHSFKISHATSGTPANGIGVGIEFETQVTAGAKTGSIIDSISTDVTGGSEDFDLSFKLMTAGATAAEKFRFKSTGDFSVNSSVGTSGQVLTSGGAGASPTWTTIGSLAGLTTNRIPYATSSTTLGDDSALTWNATNNALTIDQARFHTTNGSGGNGNLFIGDTAGNFTLSGLGNTGIGLTSLTALTSGNLNTAFGSNTLQGITTSSSNTAIGYGALGLLTSGDSNIAIGSGAANQITSGSNNIVIGNSDPVDATSNQLIIQNIIYGLSNAGTNTTVSTGFIGIGQKTPTYQLHITGNAANKNLLLVEEDGGVNILEIIEAAGVNKIGLFAASPVAQATTGGAASTFAANTSLIANDTATWDSYTVGQVVKALRNIGILA